MGGGKEAMTPDCVCFAAVDCRAFCASPVVAQINRSATIPTLPQSFAALHFLFSLLLLPCFLGIRRPYPAFLFDVEDKKIRILMVVAQVVAGPIQGNGHVVR